VTKQEIIDACAEAAHEAWFEEKLKRLEALASPLSWLSETGEEQLVRWEFLSEPVREFDRIVVSAIVDVMAERGILELP
jgi:hypothetical protein